MKMLRKGWDYISQRQMDKIIKYLEENKEADVWQLEEYINNKHCPEKDLISIDLLEIIFLYQRKNLYNRLKLYII